MTASTVLAVTAPVKKFGVVRVSSPAPVLVRPPVPVSTLVTEVEPVVVTVAVVGPPVMVPPLEMMTLETAPIRA